MKVGSLEVAEPIVLAPMAGVADLPFRTICREWGACFAVGEMTASRADLRSKRKSMTRWVEAAEEGLKVVQLLGADPAVMAQAAAEAEAAGADIVDVNMGCPAKKVLQTACGSALMKDEALVKRILEAVVGAVSIPATLKIRTGWDAERKNALSIAKIAEDAGIAMIAVHGRTRADGFRGHAEYQTIRAVKAAVGIPVIANGDIVSGETARRVLDETGADGVMIGRGALGAPWLFGEVRAALGYASAFEAPSLEAKRETVLRHMRLNFDYYGSRRGALGIRKHLACYLRALPDSAESLGAILRETDPARQTALVDAFFKRLQAQSCAADNQRR